MKTDTHERERPGGGIEPEVDDLDHLVAITIAGGPAAAKRSLARVPTGKVRAMLLDEAMTRALVLLREAGGDPARAFDALLRERERWGSLTWFIPAAAGRRHLRSSEFSHSIDLDRSPTLTTASDPATAGSLPAARHAGCNSGMRQPADARRSQRDPTETLAADGRSDDGPQ